MAGLGKTYEVIVIGGGINGLCAAAYLQKAGLKVAVFERRDEVGTFCNTEEVLRPGVRANLHATGLMTAGSPAYLDLELEKFGLELLAGEWGFYQPFMDRSAIVVHNRDEAKSLESFASFSEKDARTYTKMKEYFAPIHEAFQHLFWSTPATDGSWARFRDIINRCPVFPSDWENLDGYQLMDTMYESRHVKAMFETLSLGFGIEPWHKHVGILTQALLFTIGISTTCRGGSHALPHALLRCIVHHGGSVFQGCPVDKIITEDGVATGVVLSKYAVYPEAEVRATKAVISNLQLMPTFLNLVGENKLPRWVADAVRNFETVNSVPFTAFFVLKGEHRWDERYPEGVQKAYAFNFGIDSRADVERLRSDCAAGRLPDPPICCSSNFPRCVQLDPTQAPPGYTTLLTFANVPYNQRQYPGGVEGWDDLRDMYADKIEDVLEAYGSNVKEAKVSRYVATPLDTYRRNPASVCASQDGGPITPSQFYTNRPFAGCGAPRTPFHNLYISNSIWPLGISNLGSGAVCAQVVAQDHGVRDQEWWTHTGVQSNRRVMERLGLIAARSTSTGSS